MRRGGRFTSAVPPFRGIATAPPGALASQRDFSGARRHIGLYAYRVGALLRLAQLPPGQLEAREKLEQLRALEHGFNIQVAEACERPGPDVNTLADLERVAALLAHDAELAPRAPARS